MHRTREHAPNESFSSLTVHPSVMKTSPKLKMTHCTWTLPSLQRFKVIILHNQAMCDPSSHGACCVMLQWQRATSVPRTRFRVFYKLPISCFFYWSICLSHVLTLLNSSLTISLCIFFFHFSSDWTAQLVMSILVHSHTNFLPFFFPLLFFNRVSSCLGAAVLKWVRDTDRDTSCIQNYEITQY